MPPSKLYTLSQAIVRVGSGRVWWSRTGGREKCVTESLRPRFDAGEKPGVDYGTGGLIRGAGPEAEFGHKGNIVPFLESQGGLREGSK